MKTESDRRFVYTTQGATHCEFVKFWAAKYDYPREKLYAENICVRPHTKRTLRKLWLWKIDWKERLQDQWPRILLPRFVSKARVASQLPAQMKAKDFLQKFPRGGAIYRIFWLHCWHPHFPIYDQHVHRAMTHIKTGKFENLPNDEQETIDLYLEDYLPFYKPYADAAKTLPFVPGRDGIRTRKADRALWTFGKCLLSWQENGLL